MGEGSAIVVLEELEHAKRRGAKIYAELTGYGCSSDAYHITSPAEDGSGAATAMLNALKDGGGAPDELTYINAHMDLVELIFRSYACSPNANLIALVSNRSL